MARFSLFLATGTSPELLKTTFGPWDWNERPINVLVTFPFIKAWDAAQTDLEVTWPVKSTILDSGAFSAWNSGKIIDFNALCEEAGNGRWNEAVCLDVIGDPIESLANARRMKARGLHVMPVFHYAEDFGILQAYKDEFNRIGLSCRFGEPIKESYRWLDQCFARAYPLNTHSFGWVAEKMLMRYPFCTADTASWHTNVRFGKGLAYKNLKMPRRTEVGPSAYDLRADVLAYLDLEKRIQGRWQTELQQFAEIPKASLPSAEKSPSSLA